MTEQSVLRRMANEAVEDTEKWFPETQDLAFMALAMAGEVGEVANLLKKVVRGTHLLPAIREDLEEEVTDVFIYLLNLAGLLGMDLEAAYYAKQKKNAERFGKNAS